MDAHRDYGPNGASGSSTESKVYGRLERERSSLIMGHSGSRSS